MDEGLLGLLVFAALTVLVSWACHRRLKSFEVAVLISGPLAAISFQTVATLWLGHLDPLFIPALFTTTLVGWVISYVVGYALLGGPCAVERDRGWQIR